MNVPPPDSSGPQPTVESVANANNAQALAIISLVLGILGGPLFCIFPCMHLMASIPAVICGHYALYFCKRTHDPGPARGLALAGLILGYIGLGVVALLALIALMVIVAGILEKGGIDWDALQALAASDAPAALAHAFPQP